MRAITERTDTMESFVYFKHVENTDETSYSLQGEVSKDDEDSGKRWILCRNCSKKIALISDKIHMNNTDTYIFENPAGLFFRVICFSNAPGTVIITDYTEENTWFEGFLWSVCLCGTCGKHLGWHYSSGSYGFYGLIADRLTMA